MNDSSGGGIDTTIIGSYAGGITSVINDILVPLVFTVCVIVFLYGVAKAYILSRGDPNEVSEGHKLIFWGIIGFAVMLSVWGLVNLTVDLFGLGGSATPPPLPKIPTS